MKRKQIFSPKIKNVLIFLGFKKQCGKLNQFKETFLRNFPLLKSAEEWLNGHQHCSYMKSYVLLKLKKPK